MEVESWKDNYALLNKMTEEILTAYPNEDSSNLQLNSQALANRWNNVRHL